MNKEIPTIIIGLGGIGSEIVAEVEKKMQQGGKARGRGGYKRENVRFVIADTDINSIREREKEGYGGYSVRLSGNISVSHCLEKDETAKSEWFPDNQAYYRKSIAEGAGQIRAISRLSLHQAIKGGMLQPLYNAIDDLFQNGGNLREQEMKIAIVSTIAGGTGSGALLPLGIHIKDYLNRVYSGSGAKINGFLILPDVLYGVIPSREERRNLNANSYAAIKEIDALVNGSQKPYVKLPNEKNDENTSFSEAPFDFCFLFGRLSSQKTVYGNIEDYKGVIARCLYTQFLGTLAPQYLSKEDNVLSSSLRPVGIGESHYERFAGAGCSVVRYPLAEITEYLSICWMLDTMGQEWVKYDKERKERRRKRREKRENGKETGADMPGADFLAAAADVDKQEKEKNREYLTCEEKLALVVQKKGCHNLVEELGEYIRGRIDEKRSDLKAQAEDGYDIIERHKANYKIGEERRYIKNHLEDYMALKEELEAENNNIYLSLSDSIERELCRPHMGEPEAHYVEYYIKDENNEFASPNFIRFFLYKLEEDAGKRKIQLENDIESAEESIRQRLDDDKEVPIEKARVVQMVERIKGYHAIYEEMDGLLRNKVENHCISGLIAYIKEIAKNYESFFAQYDRLLAMAGQQKDEMEKRFDIPVLKMEYWVYADNLHLQSMLNDMKEDAVYYAIGGSVSQWLYERNTNKNAVSNDGNVAKEYEYVKEMWKQQFIGRFQKNFDMNVLQALEKEARERKGEAYIAYMREKLKDARDNAAILLSACRRPDIIMRKYCVYPEKLRQSGDCHEIVREFLDNGLAFSDSCALDVDDKELVFFEVGYGFLPSDIDFFADDPGMCADYPAGSGAQSYKWTVKNICGEEENAKITPHIDRRWHKPEYLDVNWEIKAFTPYTTKILWVMYTREMEKASSAREKYVGSEKDEEIKKQYQREFEQYFEQGEEKLQQTITEVARKELKLLKETWKNAADNDLGEICKRMVHRVCLIQKMIVEKWCHSQAGEEYLKKKLKEDFFELFMDYGEVTERWATAYRDAWEKNDVL